MFFEVEADQLLTFHGSHAHVNVFQLVLKSHIASRKVKYRFVDFFVMVPSSLSKVNCKCINETLAFSSGQIYILS